jgi:predicted nucleotide-binding protein (sugar kinase/HSP70/actin superfamily)
MYENLPFWAEFFRTLGCEVVLSGESSRELYLKGQGTIPSDTVCYPAKLVHGHIEALAEKGVTFIFYPCMTYNFDEGVSDNCYNCPVVAYYPELIRANMPGCKNIISPHLSLNDESLFVSKAFDLFRDIIPGLGFQEVRLAAKNAYAAYAKYMASLVAEGERALKWAQMHAAKVVVLASRPYHADPEVNHGIDRLLTSLGFAVLTDDSIPRVTKPDVNILNQWTYHARMYNAAAFVAENSDIDMEMVQLVSFGCGLDAVTTDEIRDILREKAKLYSMLKIDEINNLGAAKIRMRSLLAAMDERSRKTGGTRIAR